MQFFGESRQRRDFKVSTSLPIFLSPSCRGNNFSSNTRFLHLPFLLKNPSVINQPSVKSQRAPVCNKKNIWRNKNPAMEATKVKKQKAKENS